MGQRVIALKILNEFIQGDNVVIGAVDGSQSTLLEIDFRGSDVWEGTSRYITFTDSRGGSTEPRMLALSELAPGETDVYFVPVPAAALRYPGEITVTLAGYTIKDDKIIMRVTTEAATFRVLPNDHQGWSGEEIEPTAAERMQADIDLLKDITFGNWMFLEVGEDGYLYELRIDAFPVAFGLDEGRLEVTFA